MRKLLALGTVGIALILGAILGPPASASTFEYQSTDGGTSWNIAGLFSTSAIGGGTYVTSASAAVNSTSTISLVSNPNAPGTSTISCCGGIFTFDNQLLSGSPLLTNNGLMFSGGGFYYNILFDTAAASYALYTSSPTGNVTRESFGNFSVSSDTAFSATPIPAALPLFASGLGAMGLLGWRRKRKTAARAA